MVDLRAYDLSAPQIAAINRIIRRARNEVTDRYSTGYPHFHGGGKERPLGMHNLVHTDHIIRDTQIVGQAMGLGVDELRIGSLTAAPHDVIQLLGDGKNEAASIAWTERQLKDEGFETPLITIVSQGIEATRVTRTGYMPTGQYFSRLKYASQFAEDNALCVSASDFGDFFKDIGPLIGAYFYNELQKTDPRQTPPLDNFPRYWEGQIRIAQTWKFPSNKKISRAKVERLLAPERKAVTNFYEKTLALWNAGKIDGWGGLIKHCSNFMKG